MIKNIKKHIVISMTFTAFLLSGCGDKRQEISSYGNQETIATATDAAKEEEIKWDEVDKVGDCTINLQVSFEDRSNTTYPIVKCRKRVFTAEEKKSYLDKLSEGTEIYYGGDDYYTKEYWKRIIDEEQYDYEDFLNKGFQHSESAIQEYNKLMEYYKAHYEKAEEEYTIAESFEGYDYVIIKYGVPYRVAFNDISLYAQRRNDDDETDGYNYSSAIVMEPLFNEDILPENYERRANCKYYHTYDFREGYTADEVVNQYKLSNSQIESFAYNYLDNLGFKNFTINGISDVWWNEYIDPRDTITLGYNGYAISFRKCYEDEFVLRTQMEKRELRYFDDNKEIILYPEYEYGPENIILVFDERGVIYFGYSHPTNNDEFMADKTSIISADELKPALLKGISNNLHDGTENVLTVDKVKFGYVRKVNPEDSDELTAVPAYLFYLPDSSQFGVVAINAIDGSQIEVLPFYCD